MHDNPDPAQPRTCHGCGGTCSCVTTVATQELQPLVAELRGYLEALARSGGADPRLLAAATAASDRARARIDALAAYGVVNRPAQRRPLPLGPLAATVADNLQEELAARGLIMQIGTLPSVTGDARQLYQALVVLVRLVAADAERGTTITIEASRHHHEWQLHIGTRPAPGHAADTPGRPILALLSGIELMTAQRVAEAHDGRVWSDDPADGGHTLHLSIADAVHDPAAAARPTDDVHDLRPAG
jgi:signal transduction histidine kinase